MSTHCIRRFADRAAAEAPQKILRRGPLESTPSPFGFPPSAQKLAWGVGMRREFSRSGRLRDDD